MVSLISHLLRGSQPQAGPQDVMLEVRVEEAAEQHRQHGALRDAGPASTLSRGGRQTR
jgi:hypothetical protein